MEYRYHVTLFYGLLIFVVAEVSAQVVITRADWDGLVGQTAISTSYGAIQGQDAIISALMAQQGIDQVWNLTSLIFGETPSSSTIEFISPVEGLPGANNPKAQGANFAVRSIPISGKRGADFNISFYTVSNDDVKSHGGSFSDQGVVSDFFYDQPYTVLPFPYQNGSTWQDTFTWTLTDPPGNYSQLDDGIVNSEGTLVTPVGNVSVFRSLLTSTLSIDGVPVTNISRIRFESQDQALSATLTRFGTIPPSFDFYSAIYTTNVPAGAPTDPPADPPGNLGPADGASVSQTPNLTWAASADAIAYWLQVGDNAGFTKGGTSTLLVDQQGIQATSFVVNGLAAGTTYYWRVRGQNALGDGPWSNGLSFNTAGGVAVERIGGEIPTDFELYPSYPNPFNPETTIKFDIAQQTAVRLAIYDALGREVDVLVSEQLTAGRYTYNWNASSQPSGLFLFRLEAGTFSKTGRMMLVK